MTILALLAAAATSAAPTVTVAPPPGPPPSSPGAVSMVAHPHSCRFFPPAAILNRVEGDTLMSFTVAVDGSVQSPAVAKSSGNADLDAAALACVTQWRYRPATKDGVPVATPWKAIIHWVLDRWRKPLVEKQPAPSCDVDRARIALARPSALTSVQYQVALDGTVGGVAVMVSSGDAALDKSVVDCIAKIRFEPVANADGKPIPVLHWTIKWAPEPPPPEPAPPGK